MLKKGNYVYYAPYKGCDKSQLEYGVVSRDQEPGNETVFVKYDNRETKMWTGDEPFTSQNTRVNDLTLISDKRTVTRAIKQNTS